MDQSESERKSWYRNHREKSIYSSFDDVSVRERKKASGCPTFLKRSHSFAVSKETLLNGVIPSVLRNSKSKKKEAGEQFIPRAKLVEKSLSREQRLSLQNLKNLSSLSIDRKNHSETCLNNIAYTSLSNLRWQSSEYMSPYARNITRNFGHSNNFTSLNNLSSTNWNFSEFETSISYDENITLARKKIEDQQLKPKTIRAPTPYYHVNLGKKSLNTTDKALLAASHENLVDSENTDPQKNNSNVPDLLDDWDNPPPSDNIEDTKIKDQTENIYAEYHHESDNPSSIDFETNTNFDEIHLENDNIHKDNSRTLSVNPILPVERHYKTYIVPKPKENNKIVGVNDKKSNKRDITRIKVKGDFTNKSTDNHITKIEVDLSKTDTKQRFLEPNLAVDKNILEQKPNHCLCEKFSSLPDISQKNLQNYEKTDENLRKLEKSKNMSKLLENKFVVNIGRHFDVSEKTQHNGNYQPGEKSKINGFHTSQNGTKIINWASTQNMSKTGNQNKITKDVKINDKDSLVIKSKNELNTKNNITYDAEDEIKAKLKNMRQYWNKIGKSDKNEQETTCKIVEFQKKQINHIEKVKEDTINSDQSIISSRHVENNSTLQNNASNTNHQNIFNTKPVKNNEKAIHSSSIAAQNTKEKLQKSKTIADFTTLKNNRNKFYQLKEKVDHNHNDISTNISNKCESLTFDHTLTSKSEDTLEEKGVVPNIKKQLFYNSLKVNRGFNQEELPNPETVRLTRQFFEKRLRQDDKIKSQSIRSVSGSLCDLSDLDGREHVNEAILEKIREHGSTVTYYGGKIVDQHSGEPVLTKVIMKEIAGIQNVCK